MRPLRDERFDDGQAGRRSSAMFFEGALVCDRTITTRCPFGYGWEQFNEFGLAGATQIYCEVSGLVESGCMVVVLSDARERDQYCSLVPAVSVPAET
jgi:hypothetical protein